jgi:hypothetical protein
LALDPGNQLLLLDVDVQVPALEIARDGEGYVDIAYCLRPFVWEGLLLGRLLGAGGSLFGGRRFCDGGVLVG